MSVICQNFVQNAWKKELCSNCFKSKDEHVQKMKQKFNHVPKAFSISSIIRNTRGTKQKNKVYFKEKLVEVIGIGGEDWSEDEADVEIYEEPPPSEETEIHDDEEFKAVEKLTKLNTDFNANIPKDIIETKKSYSQLLLGKPQVDSEGRKHTLKVCVVPFGEEKKSKSFIQIPITKNKGAADDNKNVVLKSYSKTDNSNEEKSLLDEITETLQNSKNPIQIISRKKQQNTSIIENKENMPGKTESKDLKNDNKTERKNGLTRNPVIKRDDKPLIVHTAVAKIELKNTKDQKGDKTEVKTNFNPPILKNNSHQQQDENKNLNTTEAINTKLIPGSSSSSEVDSVETSSRSSEEDSSKEDSDSSLDKLSSTFVQSRELAGEPDGRADPDNNEPPALPLTPPPTLEPQIISPEKPKVPNKPATILIKKPINTNLLNEIPQVLTTFSVEPDKVKLTKQDSNGSDICKATNKRRAPNPPNEEIIPMYTRHSVIAPNNDSPVVREKEKRERASSCSPKVRNFISNNPQGVIDFSPEPAPRKSLSISTDSLTNCVDEKKKMKGRFSLKKFLRMGTNKEFSKIPLELARSEEEVPPQVKPRLVIVHPIDLNNSKVEVVNRSDDLRGPKPPPPPRNYDDSRNRLPHPPKPSEIAMKNKICANIKKDERVYANIGEVRSSLTPNKPQRTASMREREAGYESVSVKVCKRVADSSYDCVSSGSSSAEYETCKVETCKEQPPVDNSGEYYKYSIPRSTSMTYCGSETESEIYSPYSYYGSESEVAEDEDWNGSTGRTHKLRSKKGRSIVHKNLEDNYGAVIVANHEALAQVLENIQHNPATPVAYRGLKCAPNLRWSDFSLKNPETAVKVGSRVFYHASWGAQPVTLVISAGSVPTSPLSLGTLSLAPITEFSDLLPIKFLPSSSTSQDVNYLQATVAVLPSLQVNTIQSYGEILKNRAAANNEEVSKDAHLLLLQLVNALKTLQAQGIEELPISLTSFVLCKDVDKESFYNRLYVLQGLGENMTQKTQEESVGSLCSCVLSALQILQPTGKLTTLLTSLLNTERAVSLTQVKSVLEFSLWGPSDVALGSKIRERELALQRWLDLQRATVLHGLVCAKVQLTVYEECHLIFLVRSNAKMMCEASLLLEANKKV